MSIGIATHIKSGKQVEFMHYTKGNYENTLKWYERDSINKAVYGRDEIIAGDGFECYTLECRRELINTDWCLMRWGEGDYTAVCPRDFKEWFEVEPLTAKETGL